MAFPTGWPPRPATHVRSIRFFVSGTATANYSDSAWIFAQQAGANPFQETPKIDPGDERTEAKVGDTTAGGSPLGGGKDEPIHESAEPMIWAGTIMICNDGAAALQFSFDGTNDAGEVAAGEQHTFRNMHEAGIAVKGVTDFRIFAW
jgi:hypothetical protein